MSRPRSVLYVQYADPTVYPPVERSAAQFRERGWAVKFLGIYAEGQAAGLAKEPESADAELLTHRKGGLDALRSYLRFWRRAVQRARREKPDIVYCSDQFSYPAGLIIAMTTPAVTVLHEHDSPLGGDRLNRLLHKARSAFARRADLRINPQIDRARLMERETRCPPVIVAHNCPAKAELAGGDGRAKAPGMLLWHHGSLNAARFPFAIIDAMAKTLDDVHVEIAGYETVSSIGFVDALIARAAEHGIAHRVRYLGALPRDELFERARRAHVGLALFVEKFIEPMVGASNKPFDYLGCGMPLLVNSTAEWEEFFVARGVAKSCRPDDAEDIARVIKWYRNHPVEREAMAQAGSALTVSEWNYEAQFGPVVDRLERLVAERRAA